MGEVPREHDAAANHADRPLPSRIRVVNFLSAVSVRHRKGGVMPGRELQYSARCQTALKRLREVESLSRCDSVRTSERVCAWIGTSAVVVVGRSDCEESLVRMQHVTAQDERRIVLRVTSFCEKPFQRVGEPRRLQTRRTGQNDRRHDIPLLPTEVPNLEGTMPLFSRMLVLVREGYKAFYSLLHRGAQALHVALALVPLFEPRLLFVEQPLSQIEVCEGARFPERLADAEVELS